MFKDSWKYLSTVTLICVIIISAFLSSKPMVIKAQPPPYFSIEATVTTDPYWGYYGGYHDIWAAIQTELAKIGITLTIDYYDAYTWWYQVWEDGWNHTGDNHYPPGGWDLTMLEWWLQPHAIEPWFASMTLNNMTPPDGGFNIHPWMNSRADYLLLKGIQSFDAATRQSYLWAWQEEFMHDPPIAEIYYPRTFEAMASYILGYDPAGCWWYDPKHLDINVTEFELTVGPGGSNPNSARYAAGDDTVFYAVSEDVWSWNPMFMDSYTEENFGTLVYDTLYTWSLNYTDEQWLTAGIVEPNYWDYTILPELAADYPIVLDGGTRMRVPLREGVLWSDGEPFNATDVKFTFDCTFDLEVMCSGTGDFSYAIESVELVPDPGGVTDPYTGQGPIDPYMVDFILRFPHPDFTSVIANDWGGGSIVPWHSLKDILPKNIKSHQSNNNWHHMLPGTGPFTVTDVSVNNYIKLERNDLHWGYGLGYGPHVSTVFFEFIPEAPTRLLAIQNNDVDFGEYPTASVEDYEDMKTWDNIRVYEYDYPASNGVWFNFDNQYLSNRYVRQAIAHAIPYPQIADNILPGWGISTAYPGKSYILPVHHYEGVHLFNDDLQPYEYSILKAAEYLKMWLYSQPTYAPAGSPEVALGPVGDADFSGFVDYDDFFVWYENYGVAPGAWPWIPGRDIDPDFNNDNGVTLADFDEWSLNWAKEYPFADAR